MTKLPELEMVLIPAGSFVMGSPEEELERSTSEGPQREVTFRKPFLLGKYPITQAQWRAVAALPQVDRELDPDPSRFKGGNRPVESISWYDAQEFCARLSQATGKRYRLPSEAEWEYACRAGTTTPFYFGETLSPDIANYDGRKGKYLKQTSDVGSFPANAFGLYDMHGNVWEWCADRWHSNYEGAPTNGSAWIDADEELYMRALYMLLRSSPASCRSASYMLRGGSWFNDPAFCRSATRVYDVPDGASGLIGLRLACAEVAAEVEEEESYMLRGGSWFSILKRFICQTQRKKETPK